tara:strand:- start:360 stop:977 length:618 start_codon:yes stop_codon:yes gene_type:complete
MMDPHGVVPRGPGGANMLNIKNARLRSEHDVQLLRNRLERLRQEERKTLKKIEETRRRADQIITLKTRNEQTHLRKQMLAQHVDEQQQRARERLLAQKLESSDATRANNMALQEQKRREAAILREQRALIEDHVRRTNDEHVERARELSGVRAAAALRLLRTRRPTPACPRLPAPPARAACPSRERPHAPAPLTLCPPPRRRVRR